MMPGRLISFHCMNLPSSKERDGFIGVKDFRGDMLRIFQAAGFVFHSEVCIWKDPVTAMQRTKAIGLLHKQMRKDSALSRQGIPDYLVTVRKLGDNTEPVAGPFTEFAGENPPPKTGIRSRIRSTSGSGTPARCGWTSTHQTRCSIAAPGPTTMSGTSARCSWR
jgi:hypothetical protein